MKARPAFAPVMHSNENAFHKLRCVNFHFSSRIRHIAFTSRPLPDDFVSSEEWHDLAIEKGGPPSPFLAGYIGVVEMIQERRSWIPRSPMTGVPMNRMWLAALIYEMLFPQYGVFESYCCRQLVVVVLNPKLPT